MTKEILWWQWGAMGVQLVIAAIVAEYCWQALIWRKPVIKVEWTVSLPVDVPLHCVAQKAGQSFDHPA